MSSRVQICNMALAALGQDQFIQSPTERSKGNDTCSLFYDTVRDLLLRAHDWNFARRRRVLALTAAEVTNWQYAYRYPSDCLAIRWLVIVGTRTPARNARVPYEIATDGDQKLILTDLAEAEIVYTARITNTTLFDETFVHAFSLALGVKIAMPMAVDPGLAKNVAQQAREALGEAIAGDLNEEQADIEPESELITVRA